MLLITFLSAFSHTFFSSAHLLPFCPSSRGPRLLFPSISSASLFVSSNLINSSPHHYTDQSTDLRRLANQRYLILLLLLLSSQLKPADGNQAPNINYSNNMRVLKLPKDTKIGSIIYRLKGSDPDSDTLTFACDHYVCSSIIEFKSCSFTEADVYLKAPLEVCPLFYSCLLITYRRGGLETGLQFHILRYGW